MERVSRGYGAVTLGRTDAAQPRRADGGPKAAVPGAGMVVDG